MKLFESKLRNLIRKIIREASDDERTARLRALSSIDRAEIGEKNYWEPDTVSSRAHLADDQPNDYEECGYCGYDHEYEPEEAHTWHSKNDPSGDLYK